jgi:hypothetical protein
MKSAVGGRDRVRTILRPRPGSFVAKLARHVPTRDNSEAMVPRRAEEAVIEELRQGREAVENRAWTEAYVALSQADGAAPLAADDLELLATCAFMLGRDDEYLSAQERAHHAYLRAGENLRAVRCAFWVGMNLALRGEMGPASGWLGRAQRMLEREENESVEHGYMLMPLAFQHEAAGDFEAGAAVAGDAAAMAERFGDAEAFALAASVQGELLIKAGRVRAWRCWTRRWSARPAGNSPRSRRGSSTAESSSPVRRCTRCVARESGRMLWGAGGSSNRT